MKIDYDPPELTEAKFGQFVQGASLPGGDGDNDSNTGDL